jgi:hypothetical protein
MPQGPSPFRASSFIPGPAWVRDRGKHQSQREPSFQGFLLGRAPPKLFVCSSWLALRQECISFTLYACMVLTQCLGSPQAMDGGSCKQFLSTLQSRIQCGKGGGPCSFLLSTHLLLTPPPSPGWSLHSEPGVLSTHSPRRGLAQSVMPAT